MTKSPAPTDSRARDARHTLQSNRLHLWLIAAIGVSNLLYANAYAMLPVTAGWSLGIMAVTLAFMQMTRSTSASRIVVPVLGMLMVAVHINAARGLPESHFLVFAYLAALLLYRHWLPIIVGAAAIALHHLVVNELQLLGFGVYCFGSGDRARVLLHAAYVVAEAGVLLQMTRYTVSAFREGEEAAGLFTHVGREPNRFDLRVRQLPVQTEAGRVGRDSLANLGCAIGCIIQGLDRISGNTRRIAGANDDLNTRAARQAGDLLQTDEAVTSIASGADTNALSATSASDHVNRIIDSMNEGDALMSQLVSQVQEVSHFSDQINAFVGVIDGIAFQTNILALNAAVEAARAGEQGRGFAVVAAEVRSLAQRAAGAAREVHQLIGRSGQAIANSATLAEQSGRNVKDLVQATSALQTLIDAIQSASAEQSSAVLQIQQTVSELNRLTQDNASLANDNALITRELHDDVEQVYDVLKAFDTDKA